MSNVRDDIRKILLDVSDSIRREPDLVARVHMADEFIKVALAEARDLRDSTCYALMETSITTGSTKGLPTWVEYRAVYAKRWAMRRGLPARWRVGRPFHPGPDAYIEIEIPD